MAADCTRCGGIVKHEKDCPVLRAAEVGTAKEVHSPRTK